LLYIGRWIVRRGDRCRTRAMQLCTTDQNYGYWWCHHQQSERLCATWFDEASAFRSVNPHISTTA